MEQILAFSIFWLVKQIHRLKQSDPMLAESPEPVAAPRNMVELREIKDDLTRKTGRSVSFHGLLNKPS